MPSSTELLPITPLQSEGAEFSWFGLARYTSNDGQSLPRFSPPSAAQAQSIPTPAEKKQALGILAEFAEAEKVFWWHNSEKIEREIERTQSKVKIYQLGKQMNLCDPEIFGQAAGKMKQLRTQAGALAASLLDKLAAQLHESLKQIALRLGAELVAQGHPLTDRIFEGAGSYSTKYTLHGDPFVNQAQLRYELVRHCAARLRDAKHVSAGVAGEFDVLRWFVGERTESPLSV